MRISGRKLSVLLFLVLLAALVIRIMVLRSEDDDEESFYRKIFDQWEETAVCRELPLLSFSQEEHPQTMGQLVHKILAQSFPWYAYEKLYLLYPEEEEAAGDEQEEEAAEAAGDEQLGESTGKGEERKTDRTATGGGKQQKENGGQKASDGEPVFQEDPEKQENTERQSAPICRNDFETRLQESMEDSWTLETAQISSQPVFAQALIDNAWWDFKYLIHNWYTVDTSTDASVVGISTPELVTYPAGITKNQKEGYDILVYHTHSLEQYADSHQYAPPNGVVGAGEFLSTLLEKQYGYRVLHLTESFDAEGRDSAYGKALPALVQVLEEHPEIQVVIDLHRDEVDSNAHLIQQVRERSVARYMFFNGLSYTRTLGALKEFSNPCQKENLAMSFQLQLASDALFPGCTRKIYLKGYRYNMHLRPRSLLIELGAQNNTEQEAWNSCVLLAKMLDTVLSYNIR